MANELERNQAAPAAVARRPVTTYSPATDIVEDGDHLTIRMDMPGVTKDQLGVKFADGVLTITGARQQKDSGLKARHEEFGDVRYSRAFTVPDTLDATRTDAVLKNGVLTLTVPKVEAARPRKIEVKVQ
jgi:HSP20 family molecular chaperone IbpA